MSTDETTIYEFLKTFSNLYVSVAEISRQADRRRFYGDRNWTRPVLRRMELDGVVESNAVGEYRVKLNKHEEETSFREAMKIPGANLADTDIIILDGQDSPVA